QLRLQYPVSSYTIQFLSQTCPVLESTDAVSIDPAGLTARPPDPSPDLLTLYGYLDTKAVGCRYYAGRALVGDFVQLRRQPNNQYDANAISVSDDLNGIIGHLPRNEAKKLAPHLDTGYFQLEGIVTKDKGVFECPLTLKIFGPSDPTMKRKFTRNLREGGFYMKEEAPNLDLSARGSVPTMLPPSAMDLSDSFSQDQPSFSQPFNSSQAFEDSFAEFDFDDGLDDLQEDLDVLLDSSTTFNPRQFAQNTENYGTSEVDLEKMPQAECPKELKTQLLPYQRQGLAWMLNQENPSLPEPGSQEAVQLWKRSHSGFYNIVSMWQQPRAPSLASGGILADDMGLGKTLQVIALIIANRERHSDKASKTTLIISPLGVMSNWKDQIAQHVKEEHSLDVLIYHGAGKKQAANIDKYDVVITTYGALASEYGSNEGIIQRGMQPKTGLFSIHWRRVVLDEAHTIRTPSTKVARSAHSLRADSRWSLTGTPIVNNLKDLFSQVKFLGLQGGLNEIARFQACLIKPLAGKMGNSTRAEAQGRLQTLMGAICLRRRKDMSFINLKLPDLSSHLLRIRLSTFEQKKYDALRGEVQDLLTKYRDTDADEVGRRARARLYMNILEVLLRLRQCCNHWRLCEKRLKAILSLIEDSKVVQLTDENVKALQALLEVQVEADEACPVCICSLNDPVITTCKHVFCRSCIERWLSQDLRCPMCREPLSADKLTGPAPDSAFEESAEAAAEAEAEAQAEEANSSAKIEALIKILTARGQEAGTKTVVFSQWTSFLDIFEQHLLKYNIHFSRIDGTMNADARDQALQTLTREDTCTVMLASLSVCSVGLNLVAANQVVLADSWWAPAIEDQAVDRVYRLGQTRPVTIWRLVVEDSIEDRVLEIQKKKRELMSAAFREKESTASREARIADIERLVR
ncbi:hypothetical protein KEM55_001905, partial [Ascosphaera atra]